MAEIELLRFLTGKGFPCPVPIRNTRREYVGIYRDKPYALFTFLQGEHRTGSEALGLAAQAMAQLGQLTLGYEFPPADNRATYGIPYCWSQAVANAHSIGDAASAKKRLDWLNRELGLLQLPGDMPRGACHADANPGNFLYTDQMVSGVLDFDQAGCGWLLYDMASLIYWWAWPASGELDMRAAKTIAEQYGSIRALSVREKRHLFDMLLLVNLISYAWFIHDDSDFPSSQRRVKQLRAIGREAFYRRLWTDT